MCGIFGIAKQKNAQTEYQAKQLERTLTKLTALSVVRGGDSTGIAFVSSGKNPMIFKSLKKSSNLVKHRDWSRIVEQLTPETSVVLGHTRLKTTGKISLDNAHPFHIGSVIGTHNGIIYNHEDISVNKKEVYQVDSQAMFALFDSNDNLQECLDEIYGDYALAWTRDNKDILYLLKQDGRPCYFGYWKEARVLLYASQKDILEEAIKGTEISIKIVELTNDALYIIDTSKFNSKMNFTKKLYETNTIASNYMVDYGYSYGGNYGYKGLNSYNNSYSGNHKSIDCDECNKPTEWWDVIYDADSGKNTCLDCEYLNKRIARKDWEHGLDCGWCGDFADNPVKVSGYYLCRNCHEYETVDVIDQNDGVGGQDDRQTCFL